MDFYGIIFSSFDVFGFFNKPKATSANGFYPKVLVTNMRIKSHTFKSQAKDHLLDVAFELQEDLLTPIRQPKFMRHVHAWRTFIKLPVFDIQLLAQAKIMPSRATVLKI